MFELYTGAWAKMEELVKKGVQLTLERDPEQRVVVERQKQQRQSMDILSGNALAKKRESTTAVSGGSAVAASVAVGSSDGPRKRQSSRRLAFTLPLREPPLNSTVAAEDAADRK